MRPDEWKKLFELRDDLEGEDRTLLRKLIRYVEELEQQLRAMKLQLLKKGLSGSSSKRTRTATQD